VRGAREKPREGFIRWAIALLVIAAVLFGLIWTYPMLCSDVVMGVYSAQQRNVSVMRDCGMDIHIPIADGWYPNMLVFNAEGFAAWSGVPARMSILYTFGAFDIQTRASLLYDPASDQYSAFYGAYVVQKDGGPFGFNEDGSLNVDEVTEAVRYDDTQLVLANFGCDNPVFEVGQIKTTSGVVCAGSAGWARIDAALRVSGAAHTYKEDRMAYLQYGKPPHHVVKDFAETAMSGRIYAKYFPEYGCTVMMYVLAPALETVDRCDTETLQKTVIAALQ
jgi:hypothetical protein